MLKYITDGYLTLWWIHDGHKTVNTSFTSTFLFVRCVAHFDSRNRLTLLDTIRQFYFKVNPCFFLPQNSSWILFPLSIQFSNEAVWGGISCHRLWSFKVLCKYTCNICWLEKIQYQQFCILMKAFKCTY